MSERERRSPSGTPLSVALRPVLQQLETIAGQVARIDASQGMAHASLAEVQKNVASLVGNPSLLASRGWSPSDPPEKVPEANGPQVSFAEPAAVDPFCSPASFEILSGGGASRRRQSEKSAQSSPASMPSRLSQIANKRSNKKKRTLNLYNNSTQSMTLDLSAQAVAAAPTALTTTRSDGFVRLQYLLELADKQRDLEEKNAHEREKMKSAKSMGVVGINTRVSQVPQDKDRIAMICDTVMAVVISINSLVIAFSIDYSDEWSGWYIVDLFFVIFYFVEQGFKFAVFGFRWLFIEGSKSRRSNYFDVVLTSLDVFQISYTLMNMGTDSDDVSATSSALRLVRMLRLSRIVRVFRIAFFKDLLTMINGMLGGVQTLGWSLIMVLMPIYLVAIICRETLGRRSKDDVSYYFESVPRSMFTIFRCSFGDCSTGGGMPVFELVHEIWGWPFSIFYSLFIFCFTVGLFNVISAIFVENVISASTMNDLLQKHQRLADENLLAVNVEKLIRCVLEEMDKTAGSRLSQEMTSIQGLEISSDLFDRIIEHPAFVQALDALDICKEDHDSLFDILDSDNSGGMLFEELLAGLEKLRGEPRRSDIVCVDLMLRSIQQNVNSIVTKLEGGQPPCASVRQEV